MSRTRAIWFAAFLFMGAVLHAGEPVKIILDTDMDTYVDDAGALAMLHALADLGEAEILAVVVSSLYPWSAPTVAAINKWYGRDDLPIGSPKGDGATLNRNFRFPKEIAEEFPHPRIKANADAEERGSCLSTRAGGAARSQRGCGDGGLRYQHLGSSAKRPR